MREERRDGIAERVVLAALVLALLVPRLLLSICVTDFGADGSYYTDIAANVRDGHGVATDVSLFHHGYPTFPHPTSVYPLWPLLYGLVAKVVPLEVVGVWLPTALCAVAVWLAYGIGRRLVPRPLFEGLPVHGGHVFAALVAFNAELAVATSRPYTEGLAFVLLFGLLLRARVFWRAPGLLAGMELGAWLIVLFLTRSQFVVVGLAALATMPLVFLRRPREGAWLLLGTAVSATIGWQLYARWLGTFLPSPSLATYLRLDRGRVSDQLSEVPFLVHTEGLVGRGLELLDGLRWAFSLHDDLSYQAVHRGATWALPVAALVLLGRWGKLPVVWRFLRTPAGPNAAFLHLAALALTASLHTVHQVYGLEWIFGGRLAIPSVLLVGLSLLYLLRARVRVVRAVGVCLLAAGLYGTWSDLATQADDQCRSVGSGRTLAGHRLPIRKWLTAERERLGGLTVAVERPEAQQLAWRVPGVGIHWMTETTTVDDLVVMVNDLDVRYIVTFEVDNVKFTRDPAFLARFVEGPYHEAEGKGPRSRPPQVFAPRCSVFPGVPTCL